LNFYRLKDTPGSNAPGFESLQFYLSGLPKEDCRAAREIADKLRLMKDKRWHGFLEYFEVTPLDQHAKIRPCSAGVYMCVVNSAYFLSCLS